MVCPCAQERIFIGLDYGATNSGAHALKVLHCETHGCFEVMKQQTVDKFPTRFMISMGTSLRLMNPKEEEKDDDTAVRYTKLELLMSHPNRFNRTSDFGEIVEYIRAAWERSGVQVFGAECFGVAVNSLFEWVLADFGEPAFPKESIMAMMTFPFFTPESKESLDQGIKYVDLASKCPNMRVGLESLAALIGVLQQAPYLATECSDSEEAIIVADCGGLTLVCTDLWKVIHTLTDAQDMNVFRRGTTAACFMCSVLGGGVWLDRNFERLIDRKIDEALSSRPHLQRGEADYYKSFMIEKWHGHIKRGDSLPPMGSSFDFPFFDTQISVNRTDLEGVIMRECKKISDTIGQLRDEQFMKTGIRIKRVFITGGLGCSQIVRDLVQRMLDNSHEANPHKERLVLQYAGDNASVWNAVSRGAAHYWNDSIPVNRLETYWDAPLQQQS